MIFTLCIFKTELLKFLSIFLLLSTNKAEFNRMNQEWESLKAEGLILLEKRIPNYNAALWKAGIGAIPTAE